MLVSCLVLKNFGGWYSGMVAGFQPAEVDALERKGFIKRVEEQPEAPASEPPLEDTNLVDIPEDWAAQHHFTIIKLAKDIAGSDVPDPATKEWAVSTIEAELARRAEQKE